MASWFNYIILGYAAQIVRGLRSWGRSNHNSSSQKLFLSLIFFFIHFQWKPQAIVFGIVTNKKFDMIIMAFIGVNMLTMTLDHYDQNRMWSFALDNLNMGFIVVFTTECILKIFALRQYYFKEPWNVFDFIVVILSILGMYLNWKWFSFISRKSKLFD